MRSGTAIVVITATLIAIGVALGIAMSIGGPNRIGNFEQIVYSRDIEHGQLGFLGNCPLEREIIIEPTVKTRISWYAQQPDHHGCVRAADFGSGRDVQERLDEPKVARIELTLNPANLDQLVQRLESLSWEIEWTTLDYAGGLHSPGCENTTFSLPSRQLFVVKSENQIASLMVDENIIPDTASCIANEKANEASLDAAFASFSPLLPSQYDLRPEVVSRLYRQE